MKKILLILLLVINIVPTIYNGTITISSPSEVNGQWFKKNKNGVGCPPDPSANRSGGGGCTLISIFSGVFKDFAEWLEDIFQVNNDLPSNPNEVSIKLQNFIGGIGSTGETPSNTSPFNTGNFDWGILTGSGMVYYDPSTSNLTPSQLTLMSQLGHYYDEYIFLNPSINTGTDAPGYYITYGTGNKQFRNDGSFGIPGHSITSPIELKLHYDGSAVLNPNEPVNYIGEENNPLPSGGYTWYQNGTQISGTPDATLGLSLTGGQSHIEVKDATGNEVIEIDVELYQHSYTPKSTINTFVTPTGTPIELPPYTRIIRYPIINNSVFPDGALFGFVLEDGREFVFKEAEHYSNPNNKSPKYSGFYRIVTDANGNRKYSNETYNFTNYPPSTNNKLEVIRLRLVNVNGVCKLVQELVLYTIGAGTPRTVTNGTPQPQNTDIEDAVLITVLGENSFNCPQAESTPNDPGLLGNYFTQKGEGLKNFLNQSTKNSTKFYLFDCATGKVMHTIDKDAANTLTTAQQDAETAAFNNKTFTEDIAIKGCIENGKWKYEVEYKPGMAVHTKVNPQLQQVKDEIKNQADDEVKKLRLPGQTNDGEDFPVDNGERFQKKSMDLLESVAAIYDMGKDIISNGAMPEKIWDQGRRSATPDANAKTDYDNSPFKAPSVISGAADQIIDEITGVVQLVKAGMEVVRKPRETIAGIWKAVKDIDTDKVKKLLTSATGITEYAAGGDRAFHQGGMHSVQMAMFAFGAIKGLTKGKELIENGGDVKKLVKVSDDLDTDGAVKIKNFDQNVSDNIYKGVANGDYTHEMAETIIQETAEAERRLARKYTWPEVQALFKRGNDFNAKGRPRYPNNEITIEHATLKNADGSPKRFRLDSYVANTDIVSRKATDLANIQLSTFEGYLDELVRKYSPGGKIVSPSNPNVNGQILSGNLKLEIPASNASFPNLAQYRQIANNKNPSIEIIFLAE